MEFLSTDISQGSAAIRFRCGGIFNHCFIQKFTAKSAGEITLKIG